MITFILLLYLLDFQHLPKPDGPLQSFYVQEVVEQSTTGCAPSSQNGVTQNQTISVDWVGGDDPYEGETPVTHLSTPHFGAESPVTPLVMPYDPPGMPDPNPVPPPTATPEPPTLAILTISGIVLLFLLFGRKRQKLYRRP